MTKYSKYGNKSSWFILALRLWSVAYLPASLRKGERGTLKRCVNWISKFVIAFSLCGLDFTSHAHSLRWNTLNFILYFYQFYRGRTRYLFIIWNSRYPRVNFGFTTNEIINCVLWFSKGNKLVYSYQMLEVVATTNKWLQYKLW